MTAFSEDELRYLLGEPRLARVATMGPDGTPHVVPVGWSFNPDLDAIEIGGHDLARTKKFRDVQHHGRAAVVIDDLASIEPWRPRGIEVRGTAEAVETPRQLIRIRPERIVSWGIAGDNIGKRHARDVTESRPDASDSLALGALSPSGVRPPAGPVGT